MSISDGGILSNLFFFFSFFYTNPGSQSKFFRLVWRELHGTRFHIPTKESILHNLFRCNFFSTLRRPFPPTSAQRGRHPLPSTLLVTNHAPFFSNPSFRILFVSVNVAKLLRSIVLPFHSFSNSFLGILYKVVPNKSCRQCGWMDSLFFWLKKKGRRKREKGKLFDFGILKIKLICRFMKLAQRRGSNYVKLHNTVNDVYATRN